MGTAGTRYLGAVNANFEEFFQDTWMGLARSMWLLTGDRAEGEELAQEAFVRAYERWTRVRTMSNPVGYVYTVAFNLNRRRIRKLLRGRERRQEARIPHDDIAGAEIRVDVLDAMRRLPVRQREALILVEWLGLSADEAGAVLALKPSSTRVLLHRAREGMRQLLGGFDE